LLALSACYSPTLHDCTVVCESADDCANGQICGADKLCAAPEAAGKCQQLSGMIDAGVVHNDAGMIDAPPPAMVMIRVQIEGKGSVTLDGAGACGAQGGQHGDCTFTVAPRTQTIRVNLLPPGDPFVGWTSMTCKTAGLVCSFTASAGLTIVAKFDKSGHVQ
jgi:hypothetical protein